MRRSGGVTAAAIVAFIGSGLTLLMGLFLVAIGLAGLSHLSTSAQQNFPPSFLQKMMIAESLVYFAFAGWGIASAVGLLNLRPWARVSTLVFASFTVIICCMTAAVLVVLKFPATPELSSANWGAIKAIFVSIISAPAAIGIWWLVLFNLPSVRAQFQTIMAPDPAATIAIASQSATVAARRPISITIIAVLYLFGSLSAMYVISIRPPLSLFGHFIEGGGALFGHLFMAVINLYVGIDLLRLKPLARQVGIYIHVFGFINTLTFVVLPGWDARIAYLLSRMPQYHPSPILNMAQYMRFVVSLSLVFPPIILWFLITRKRAFLPPETLQTA